MHNIKDRAAEARAIAGALLVARLGRIQIDPAGRSPIDPGLLPASLHASAARLLVVPRLEGASPDIAAVSAAMREARVDALIVQPRTERGELRLAIHVGIHSQRDAFWHIDQRLWLGERGGAYLVPSSRSATEAQAYFSLHVMGSRPSGQAPWSSARERKAGLARADALVSAALTGR